MKNRNQYATTVEQVEISKSDLLGGKYVFAADCEFTKKMGVSPTGSTSKTPEYQINTTVNYGGHGLLEMITEDTNYKHIVDARASTREFKFFPKDLTVKSVNGCKIQVADLPAEQQVELLFKNIPVGPARDAALKAYRTALK